MNPITRHLSLLVFSAVLFLGCALPFDAGETGTAADPDPTLFRGGGTIDDPVSTQRFAVLSRGVGWETKIEIMDMSGNSLETTAAWSQLGRSSVAIWSWSTPELGED